MAIYTKKGDSGTTSLYGGKTRLPKDELRVRAYGTVDELNSHLGMVCTLFSHRSRSLGKVIADIQKDLFEIASELATDKQATPPFSLSVPKTKRLEKIIDNLEGSLPVLANFIFPGGSKVGAALHIARSVCRRAEREIVALNKKEKINPNILTYTNRLSDTLFVLARKANKLENSSEIIWKK